MNFISFKAILKHTRNLEMLNDIWNKLYLLFSFYIGIISISHKLQFFVERIFYQQKENIKVGVIVFILSHGSYLSRCFKASKKSELSVEMHT